MGQTVTKACDIGWVVEDLKEKTQVDRLTKFGVHGLMHVQTVVPFSNWVGEVQPGWEVVSAGRGEDGRVLFAAKEPGA